MINICYSLTSNAQNVAISMTSVFENTKEKIIVHLIHDSKLSTDDRQKLVQTVRQYDQRLIFYNVDESLKDLCDQFVELDWYKNHDHNLEFFYRMLIPDLLPSVSKAIWIHSKTILNSDIKEIEEIDHHGLPIAKRNEEIVSMNLEQIRKAAGKNFMFRGCYILCRDNPEKDKTLQDSLNFIFKENIVTIPNVNVEPTESDKLSYFIKTPFCTIETFQKFFDELVKTIDEHKKIVEERLKLIRQNMKNPDEELFKLKLPSKTIKFID